MKLVFIFSICAFLLINFQLSAAVTCTVHDGSLAQGTKKCPYCVSYACPLKTLIVTGCQEEFLRDCSTHTEEIDFINSKNKADLEYKKGTFVYISGCGHLENYGDTCIDNKAREFHIKTKKLNSYCLEAGKECHDPSAPAEATTNNSNNQNGAFKLVGILGIGWMLFVAAWIY
uniref:Uncharacterized protein n=1 Tax=Panagrolaimus davidi TaxID=227884 RepID=A0A914PPC7_9BILA